MDNTSKLFSGATKAVAALVMVVVMSFTQSITVEARHTSNYLDLATGITNIISPIAPLGIDSEAPEVKAAENAEKSAAEDSSVSESESETSNLVMANVSRVMNVREEPNEDGKKVGVLYKDCGGKILDRQDGWTKIQSGDLIGWAKDEYLLFDADAEALAQDVGKQIVTSNGTALNIRAEASSDA